MDKKELKHLIDLRLTHQRRLSVLEIQAANFGIYVPPHVLLEIEEIGRKIAQIDSTLSIHKRLSSELESQATGEAYLISILFLAADPSDYSRLRIGEEYREIQEKLKLSKLRDRFKLELPQLSVRAMDISQALLDTQPQIVHFSGHALTNGAVCFEGQTGLAQPVKPEVLATLFAQFMHHINCVILNACFTEVQAIAIAEHIDFVIGINEQVRDDAAIAFAAGFYQALGAGCTIDQAFDLGCIHIDLLGIPNNTKPRLIIRNHNISP